jgi:hypothetical protein
MRFAVAIANLTGQEEERGKGGQGQDCRIRVFFSNDLFRALSIFSSFLAAS